MLPSLDSLRCFTEAARLLNFRAAARSVALTPAALGQRIRQLEDQLGTPLFHRTSRSCVLTEAGLALLPHARKLLDDAEQCVRVSRGEVPVAPLELTVGTRHELGMSWLVPALPQLAQRLPNLSLHLYFGAGPDLLNRIRTLELQCAIGSMRVHDPRIESVRLHPEDYVFAAQPALLARQRLRTPEDAAAHTLIDTSPELPLYGYFRDAPGAPTLRFGRLRFMGAASAVLALVQRGEGVAVLPRYMIEDELRRRTLVPLFGRVRPLSDHFRLYFRGDDPRRAVYESLARELLQVPLR